MTYAKKNGLVRRLPAVQGSRQNINAACYFDTRQHDSYLKYADASELTQSRTSWWRRFGWASGSLHSRGATESVLCRCHLYSPDDFFTHSTTVTRPMLRTIADCGEAHIHKLESLKYDSDLPLVTDLASSVLSALRALAADPETVVSVGEVTESLLRISRPMMSRKKTWLLPTPVPPTKRRSRSLFSTSLLPPPSCLPHTCETATSTGTARRWAS